MAGLPFTELLEAFVDALTRAGANFHILRGRSRPAYARLTTARGTTDCHIYLWTITHGGRGRSENEQRIQVTGVREIALDPLCITVLGGWSSDYAVYAFWDAWRHKDFTPGSPSLQVPAEVLTEAAAAGIATEVRQVRHGREVIVALKPENVLWYIEHGCRQMHNAGDELGYLPQLIEATPNEESAIIEAAGVEEAKIRRHELVQVMRPYRDARFRHRVLAAYGYRCAVCDCSLGLVEAAHIIPVSEPDGTDSVRNGIALCRSHHGAYDSALVGLLPDYRVAINEAKVSRLHRMGLGHGLAQFRANLLEATSLPVTFNNRPAPDNLRRGLSIRQWPEELSLW